MLVRSVLFTPANRPDLIMKLPRAAADCIVLDLEDGTPSGERAAARRDLSGSVDLLRRECRTAAIFVRVNPVDSDDFALDYAAFERTNAMGIVVAKGSEAGSLMSLPTDGIDVIVGIESVRGVLNAFSIAGIPNLTGVYFGAEDFVADMGGQRTVEGFEVLHARSQVVLAAKAARIVAIDQAVLSIREDDLFRKDARLGRSLGYDGKICLLPRQVELANQAFAPSAAEIMRARGVLTAYETACHDGVGVIDFEGQMVDEVVLKHARTVLGVAAAVDDYGPTS